MEQIIPASNTGPSEDQLANNIAQNQELQAEIKNAIISKLMSNNPNLAKAIAYRSTHAQLFGSGDLASFYDQYGSHSYKKEVIQSVVEALSSYVLLFRISEKINDVSTTMNAEGIKSTSINSVSVDCGNNGCSVILNLTFTYNNGSKSTKNMTLSSIMDWIHTYV